MKKPYENLTELIGDTPLLRLNKFMALKNSKSFITAKLEYLNPLGSVKDRAAFAMIAEGEEKKIITKDTVIIEPSSGNTGIGLAFVCAAKGYKLIITMPETMSVERQKIMKALGAQLVLTPGNMGMKGAIEKANELQKDYSNSYIPQQFKNPANPAIHYKTTAPEIWEGMEGNIDIFVSAVGTGGTITGVGKYLKEKKPNIKIVAVEPSASPVLSGGSPGSHKIQGIGPGFVPDILDTDIIDEIIKVENEEAFIASREIAKSEGLLVGISSGAALHAAALLGLRTDGKNIVVVLPDTGERYLSSEMYM